MNNRQMKSEKLTSYLFLRCSSTATQPCATPAPPPRVHSHATVKVSDSRVAAFQMFACKGPELNFFPCRKSCGHKSFLKSEGFCLKWTNDHHQAKHRCSQDTPLTANFKNKNPFFDSCVAVIYVTLGVLTSECAFNQLAYSSLAFLVVGS